MLRRIQDLGLGADTWLQSWHLNGGRATWRSRPSWSTLAMCPYPNSKHQQKRIENSVCLRKKSRWLGSSGSSWGLGCPLPKTSSALGGHLPAKVYFHAQLEDTWDGSPQGVLCSESAVALTFPPEWLRAGTRRLTVLFKLFRQFSRVAVLKWMCQVRGCNIGLLKNYPEDLLSPDCWATVPEFLIQGLGTAGQSAFLMSSQVMSW